MVRCALVCITKNESRYMREFIDYYLKLGFTTICLYDNSDKNELKTFKSLPNVKIIFFPGKARQVIAYNHFLTKFRNRYDYVAFFDSDEFLVLKKHTTIQHFCTDMIQDGAIGINWFIFGNNQHMEYSPEPVTSRFTRRYFSMHPLVKTIARCRDIQSMKIHNPVLAHGKFRNCRGHEIDGYINNDFDDSIAQLNHYCTKSNQEYNWKIQRGRGSLPTKRNYSDLEPYLGYNHTEDLSAHWFFSGVRPPFPRIALVCFSGLPDLDFYRNQTISHIFVYSTQHVSPSPSFVTIIQEEGETKETFQNHFLTFFKTNFSHVLFIEPQERVSFPPNENLPEGVFYLIEPNTQSKRVFSRTIDLLSCSNFVIEKIGYKQNIQETDQFIFITKV